MENVHDPRPFNGEISNNRTRVPVVKNARARFEERASLTARLSRQEIGEGRMRVEEKVGVDGLAGWGTLDVS